GLHRLPCARRYHA
ncbi:hypothetical protein D030_3343B, partial [Vibrio parahaemolyticus AQ3810]